ncbi:MAG: hypothetical protein GY788_12430 [bacterium]|nr:hypothetical protein [bacterium]
MKYIKVKWIHEFENEPVLLFSEIDTERWEKRKVEVYANGHMDFADTKQETGKTFLGLEPLPSLEQIASDPQFQPVAISEAEFEDVWERARSGALWPSAP